MQQPRTFFQKALIASTTLLATLNTSAISQNEVNVYEGEILTADHILAGEFNGQLFTLDSTLMINLFEGGALEQVGALPSTPEGFLFDFNGATINAFNGGLIMGTIFDSSYITNSTMNLYIGGRTGADVIVEGNMTVNLLGGLFGVHGNLQEGTTINMSLGRISTDQIGSRAMLNMSGGVIPQGISGGFNVYHISGGCVGPSILNFGTELNLYVRDIAVNSTPLELAKGESVSITPTTDLMMVATLANGQPYLFDAQSGRDGLNTNITITATQMETCSADLNGDGKTDFFDISIYVQAFQTTPTVGEYDCNAMGSNNDFFDVSAFIDAFGDGCN